MLEQPALLLRPWALCAGRLLPAEPATADRQRTRAILDASGLPLGFAGWKQREGSVCWRWLRGPALAVYETEDASLLFQVRRSWVPTPRWQVRDADAHPVGTVRSFQIAWSSRLGWEWPAAEDRSWRCAGTWVNDRWGRGFALIRRPSDPCLGRWLTRDGYEVGTLDRRGEDLRITFAAELDGDPFAKMLLLAAVLVSAEW